MKKATAIILSIAFILASLPCGVFSTAESIYPFSRVVGLADSVSVTGNEVDGYTAVISGAGRTLFAANESVPINSLMLEYGFNYSTSAFGQFGVALDRDDITDSSAVNENILVFHYRTAGGRLVINFPDENGSEDGRVIGTFSSSDRHGDSFWGPNISSFGFVKQDGHWYLSVDGLVCDDGEYAALDTVVGTTVFDYGVKVYPFFGAFNSGTVYYKQSSRATPDNAISLITDDSYGFYADGNREYRGQGLNTSDSRSAIVRYDFPKFVTGSKEAGHEIDFTDTAGFAQTTEGFDLKTTVFRLSAITYDGNNAPLYYRFGFAVNPNAQRIHGAAAQGSAQTIDYRATSVTYIGDAYQNYTLLHYVTDGSEMDVKYSYGERGIYYNSHRYEATKNEFTLIDFVFTDGHWYMRTNGTTVNKSVIFDDIIEKPVYFRFGADTKSADSFKMLLQVVKKQEDGSFISAWQSDAPNASDYQLKKLSTVKNALARLGTMPENPTAAQCETAKKAYLAYIECDAVTTGFLTAEEKSLADSYAAYCFDMTEAVKKGIEINGNAADGFKLSLSGDGRQRAVYSVPQALGSLSFDFGYSYSGNLYGEFGITKKADINGLTTVSDGNNLIFFYRVSGGKMLVNIRRSGYKELTIGEFSATELRGYAGYYGNNVASFGFAKKDGHWYLTVDGMLCNNVPENAVHAQLDTILGKTAFEKNDTAYIYVGGYKTGSMYFKPTSLCNSDKSWISRSDDSYLYTLNGKKCELRGHGNTEETLHYSLPAGAASENGGCIADFSGTNGYIQSATAVPLKNLKLEFSVGAENASAANTAYYLAFTSNPQELKDHSEKPSDTVEFKMESRAGKGFTMGSAVKNTSLYSASPELLSLGRAINAESAFACDSYTESTVTVDFTQAVGADGETHWYMRTGGDTVIKSSNAENDKYLRFDELAESAYVRIGTYTAVSGDFRVYCRLDGAEKSYTDSVSYTQECKLEAIKSILADIPSDSSVAVAEAEYYITRAYDYYEALTRDALEYLTAAEKARLEALYSSLEQVKGSADTDGNGAVDMLDVDAVKKMWLNGECLLDVSDDGITDVTDALSVLGCIHPIENSVYLKDYGAVGDGVTDDSAAIFAAFSALKAAGDNSELVLESGKAYYYAPNSQVDGTVIFSLENCANVHICGNNSKIITDAPNRLLNTVDTTSCSVTGLSFTYKTRPYFMAANATEINTSAKTCVMEIGENTARDYLGLGSAGQTVKLSADDFGVVESKTGRLHMYIKAYELVSENKIKIYFADDTYDYRINMLAAGRLVCPTPNIAHTVNHAVHLSGDRDILFKDVNLYSACKFAVAVMRAEGTVTFDSFNIVPDPEITGFEKTDFVCWRDGWHLKENRARVIWNNCTATGLQDDIFNVSSSVTYVKEVLAPDTVNMYWNETGGSFRADLKRGDKVTVINTDTGEILARTEIKEIIAQNGADNIIVLADIVSGLTAGESIHVLFDNLVANSSVINGGSFTGTYRFRGPIEISNAYFDCRRMWLDIIHGLEGPIPQDIVFKGCEFRFDNASGYYVHASAYNSNTASGTYHIKNILFDSCIIDIDRVEIGAGDEVIFKNCTKP